MYLAFDPVGGRAYVRDRVEPGIIQGNPGDHIKDDPIRIGVLGEDPFNATLTDLTRDSKAQGRAIEVVRPVAGREMLCAVVAPCKVAQRGNLNTANILGVATAGMETAPRRYVRGVGHVA